MRRQITALTCLLFASLGLTAGLFAFPARADNSYGAHSVEDLQALGYRIGLRVDLSVSQCAFLYVLSGGGVTFPDLQEPVIENNVDPSHPECPPTPPAVIQSRIDALIAAYPPPPAPAVTTTDAAPATAPAVTTTTTDAPAVSAPVGAPVTTTVTVTVSDPTVDARLSALEQRQQTNEARIATLEAKAGIIVGEPKNTAPFTNVV